MKSTIVFMLLSLVLILRKAHSQPAENNCKYFASSLPLRLRELRMTFNKVKYYFHEQDDELDIMLLKEDLLEDFKGYLGCQSVGEMIQFYLEDVLPKVSTGNTILQDVGFLGDMLLNLRQTIKRCHRYFICDKKSKTIKNIKDTYEKVGSYLTLLTYEIQQRILVLSLKGVVHYVEDTMKLHDKGIYKAMGEFDTFIDYIEEYLMLKMR